MNSMAAIVTSLISIEMKEIIIILEATQRKEISNALKDNKIHKR